MYINSNFSNIRKSYEFPHLIKSVERHNPPHKYVDPKINLSELRQTLSET
ncbi:hypothetical protein LEP1GSC108_2239 [Leptospira weilii str. UI 13098]|uniref:Uncharacterized protein n=1 Tax=Leptospira weilii str. UI 13098 TaxID=1088542 RepID=M6QPH0_9LEPT|nr:hypothetical protein LEP1GSC108_2239 [Leptospira weilii str. UI 13098]